MSRNAIVSISAINSALSLTMRDFSSVLIVTKLKDVKTTSKTPVAVTSAGDLLNYGFTTSDKEYILLEGYFGASTKPDYIWVYGDSAETSYLKILNGLDVRWKNKWFYTVAPITKVEEVAEIKSFLSGTSNYYVAILQGVNNWTVENHLNVAKNNKIDSIFYIATDRNEGQSTNILATLRNFFPGSVPYATVQLNGIVGSNYSLTEHLELVGSARESETGVNIVTEEDQIVMPYYGKSLDGTTWFDYTIAKIAIDEYMRVGITKYVSERNTAGEKISPLKGGKEQLASKGTSILREFAKRGIIMDVDDVLEDGTTAAYKVEVISVTNRTAEIKYTCYYEGAIIKSNIQIELKSKNGN